MDLRLVTTLARLLGVVLGAVGAGFAAFLPVDRCTIDVRLHQDQRDVAPLALVQDSVDLGLAILVVLPLREVLHHVQSVVQSIQDKSVGAKLASALHDHGRVHESLVQELVSPLVRAGPSHLLQVQLDVVQHLREEDLLWKTDLLLILVEMAWVLWAKKPLLSCLPAPSSGCRPRPPRPPGASSS